MFASSLALSQNFGLTIFSPIWRQKSTDIDTGNTHITPAEMDGMERMVANSIIHLTMHRIHDKRGDFSQQMRRTWEQREEMGETSFAPGSDLQRMRDNGDGNPFFPEMRRDVG